MKSPSSQKWERSSSSPGLRAPLFFFFLGCFIQHRGSLEEDGVCAPV